jgi:hypothetical protein
MLFFVWGRSEEELDAILSEALSNSEIGPSDPNVCILWNGKELPAPCWRRREDLTEEEAQALTANLKARAADQSCEQSTSPAIRMMSTDQLLPIALGRKVPRAPLVH